MKLNIQRRSSAPAIAAREPGGAVRTHVNLSCSPIPASKSGAAGPSHWSEFWREFGPEGQPLERCHIPAGARFAVDAHWAGFATALPQGADVLDIGCGAGILGRTLLGHRGDLALTGIDYANVPVLDVQNLTILPWVSMEALPFEDRTFDAAISLFGIEYGEIGKTAGELGRVLKPGANFSFLTHHFESEIVCEGARRRRALRELLSPKVRAAFLSGSTTGLEQQLERLRLAFPGEPSIGLFSKCLRRDVTRLRPERQVGWQNLLNGLNTEIMLLAHLERSAKSPVEMGKWLAPLLTAMTKVSVSIVRRNSGDPIAWHIGGVR